MGECANVRMVADKLQFVHIIKRNIIHTNQHRPIIIHA